MRATLPRPPSIRNSRAAWLAVLRCLGERAFGPGQYVGQESFVSADEIVALALAAGAGPGRRVLDLCTGAGGAALYVARTSGCSLVGLDVGLDGVGLARGFASRQGLDGRAVFCLGDALAVPLRGGFDVVLLLETLLAIPDKPRLLTEVRRLLRPGGCFGLTLEAGQPLSRAERQQMPGVDAIWLTPAAAMQEMLEATGFRLRQVADLTRRHALVAGRLADVLSRPPASVKRLVDSTLLQERAASHRRWAAWLATGRVRKLALVAECPASPGRSTLSPGPA